MAMEARGGLYPEGLSRGQSPGSSGPQSPHPRQGCLHLSACAAEMHSVLYGVRCPGKVRDSRCSQEPGTGKVTPSGWWGGGAPWSRLRRRTPPAAPGGVVGAGGEQGRT